MNAANKHNLLLANVYHVDQYKAPGAIVCMDCLISHSKIVHTHEFSNTYA